MSKFKPGDLIVCKVREFGNETVGKIYQVDKENPFLVYWVSIIKDDNGKPNAYPEENFELAYPVIFNNKLEEMINE